MRETPLLLTLLLLAACANDPAGPDASCVTGVFANDLFYRPASVLADSTAISAEPTFRITRFDPTCYDEGQPDLDRGIHGESNFLGVGTPIHLVEGFGALDRLAYRDAEEGAWRILVPEP